MGIRLDYNGFKNPRSNLIEEGDERILDLEIEQLRKEHLKSAIKRFQEIIKKHNKNNISLVDSLIAERRKDNE